VPEAGHRPGRADGAPGDLQRRTRQQLQGARGREARSQGRRLREDGHRGADGPVTWSVLGQASVPPIRTPTVDWLAASPEIALTGAAVAIVLLRSLVRRRAWVSPASLAIAFSGATAAGLLLVRQWREVQDHGAITTIAGMVRIDGFGVFL